MVSSAGVRTPTQNVTGSLIIFHEFSFGSVSRSPFPRTSPKRAFSSEGYKNSRAERAVSMTAWRHFGNYVSFLSDFTRATVSQLYTVAYIARHIRKSSRSSGSRARSSSSRSKNPFLRITRGRAVGSAATENHEEKRDELIAATITLYYTVEPSSSSLSFPLRSFSMVSCRLGISSRLSRSTNVQVDAEDCEPRVCS